MEQAHAKNFNKARPSFLASAVSIPTIVHLRRNPSVLSNKIGCFVIQDFAACGSGEILCSSRMSGNIFSSSAWRVIAPICL